MRDENKPEAVRVGDACDRAWVAATITDGTTKEQVWDMAYAAAVRECHRRLLAERDELRAEVERLRAEVEMYEEAFADGRLHYEENDDG